MIHNVTSFQIKRLFQNIFSLSVLQIINYLLPLVIVPYLIRTIGIDKFGDLAFATVTVAYFGLITNYGFSLSATKLISINKENKIIVSNIFSSVITIKCALMFLSIFLLLLIVSSVNIFQGKEHLLLLSFGVVVGQVLFPDWLFQGLEKMGYITALNVAAKVIFTSGIFLFVGGPSDYWLVPLLTSSGYIASGIFSLILVRYQLQIVFEVPTLACMRHQFKNGWTYFYSNIAISLYTTTVIFLLGLFTSNTVVGYYSIADKVVQAVKGIFLPISQGLFPYISARMVSDEEGGLRTIKVTTIIVGAGMFALCITLYLLSAQILKLVLNSHNIEPILILKLLSFVPFFVSISNILGVLCLLTMGYKRAFGIVLTSAAAFGLGLSLLLIWMYGAMGAAVTVLIVEIYVTVMFALLVIFREKLTKIEETDI